VPIFDADARKLERVGKELGELGLEALGVTASSEDGSPISADPDVRAAFFLVNDLALILLRNQIAAAIGADPLTPDGMDRWAREASIVYAEGAFQAPRKE
jgi:hypothetical protein